MPEAAVGRRHQAEVAGRHWPEVGACVAVLVAYAALGGISVSPDIHWQLWIARHLNAGVPLYAWIMETNPPLWYWMAQPVAALAERLGAYPERVMVAMVFALAAVSMALCAVLRRGRSARERAALYGALLIGGIVVPLSDFGQREHEALLAIVPYALLIARRVDGKDVPWTLALAAGLLATPMVALKHYFVLLPVLLEIWLAYRQRRWRPFRPETLCLMVGALAYGGAILTFTPLYLTELAPVLSQTYGAFRGSPLMLVFNRLVPVLVIGIIFFWRARGDLGTETRALILVAAAFSASFFLQGKGWDYHGDAAIGAIVMAVIVHLAQRPAGTGQGSRLALTGAMVLVLVAVIPVLIKGPYRNHNDETLTALFSSLAPGMTLAPLMTAPALIWPVPVEMGLRLPSRYYHYWMVHAVAAAQDRGEALPARLEAFLPKVRRDTVEDFLCNPPDMIVLDTKSVDNSDFDLLAFLAEDADFRAIFAAYDEADRLGRLVTYRRTEALPPADGLECMAIGAGRLPPEPRP